MELHTNGVLSPCGCTLLSAQFGWTTIHCELTTVALRRATESLMELRKLFALMLHSNGGFVNPSARLAAGLGRSRSPTSFLTVLESCFIIVHGPMGVNNRQGLLKLLEKGTSEGASKVCRCAASWAELCIEIAHGTSVLSLSIPLFSQRLLAAVRKRNKKRSLLHRNSVMLCDAM